MSSLTSVLNISPIDSLLCPIIQWLDDNDEIVSINSNDYHAFFNMLIDTELARQINGVEEYTNELVWLDSTSFYIGVANTTNVYVVDDIASQLSVGDKVIIDNELMTISGIGAYADNMLEFIAKRNSIDTTFLDSTSVHSVYDLVNDSNDDSEFWRSQFESRFNDSTALDSTAWNDPNEFSAIMPTELVENRYISTFDSTACGHQKGSAVEVYTIFKDDALIENDSIYYKWKHKPISKKGIYRGTFELIDKDNILYSILLPRSTRCGNNRTYIIYIGG